MQRMQVQVAGLHGQFAIAAGAEFAAAFEPRAAAQGHDQAVELLALRIQGRMGLQRFQRQQFLVDAARAGIRDRDRAGHLQVRQAGAGRRFERRDVGVDGQVGLRRSGVEHARVQVIDRHFRAGERQRRKRRGLDPGIGIEVAAAGLERYAQRLQRAIEAGGGVVVQLFPGAVQAGIACQWKRRIAGQLQRRRRGAEGRCRLLQVQRVMDPVGAGAQQDVGEPGGGAVLVHQHFADRQPLQLEGQRQPDLLRQRERLRRLGRRPLGHIDLAEFEGSDGQLAGCEAEVPGPAHAVYRNRAFLVLVADVAQCQPVRDRAARILAGQRAAQRPRGQLPAGARAPVGAQRGVDGTGGQQQQQEQDGAQPLQPAPPAAFRGHGGGRLRRLPHCLRLFLFLRHQNATPSDR